MKNTSHVIGMDHSNRSMESWTRLQYFGSAGMFPPADNRCYDESDAFDAAPSYNDRLPRPLMTQFGPLPPGAFLPKPPPLTPKKPGLKVLPATKQLNALKKKTVNKDF